MKEDETARADAESARLKKDEGGARRGPEGARMRKESRMLRTSFLAVAFAAAVAFASPSLASAQDCTGTTTVTETVDSGGTRWRSTGSART